MPVTLKELISVLKHTADVLELLEEDAFRVQAYRHAARSLESSEATLEDLQNSSFKGVPKVGAATAKELLAYLESGTFAPLDSAAQQIPSGVLELFRVRGLGPKKIRALWTAGLTSLPELSAAARDGRVAALKGFGAKSAASILEAVEFALKAQERQLLPSALAPSQELLQRLAAWEPQLSGEVRRNLETVAQLDLLVTAEPAELENAGLDGQRSGSGWSGRLDALPIQIICASAQNRGAVQAWHTGSEAFRATLQTVVQQRGLRWDETGLFRAGQLLATPQEEDLFKQLGLPFCPPEYREPEHLDLWTILPPTTTLIQPTDLKGMLHTHSRWSDGSATLAEMAQQVVHNGQRFLGTGDHSRSAHYAQGLSIERLQAQLREVRELQRAGLPIIAGAEVDILPDGTLDYPDEVLAELDYVVASVHSHFTLEATAQTERLRRAVSHPLVTIWGHPTGRLLLRRPGYDFDLEAVLEACAQRGTVVEINANPHRLDLDWRIALRWRDRLMFAINTDAHSLAGLNDARYGVAVARKAGLKPQQVVNTLDQEAFLEFIREVRARRV